MSKGTFFTGQPIFSQLLQLIPRVAVERASVKYTADRYCKTFDTYDHLVSMLFGVFNQCNSLREITVGMLGWDNRIHHLGISGHPCRSTLSDANQRRPAAVFEAIFFSLLDKYADILPDSRIKKIQKNLFIIDSTTISLFKDILKASGRPAANGKAKGGIKVHTLLNAAQNVPCTVFYSAGTANDSRFLKEISLPRGSILVFDKGYRDYKTYNSFEQRGITWVTRPWDNAVYEIVGDRQVNAYERSQGVIDDQDVILGDRNNPQSVTVAARLITFYHEESGQLFQFISNNKKLAPSIIAAYYKQRWQVEIFYKHLKQNFPLQYFLGDSENAIKIQIWCALIADLLLKVIRSKERSPLSFSNTVSLVRLHLMTYMHVGSFLRNPERTLRKRIWNTTKAKRQMSLFDP